MLQAADGGDIALPFPVFHLIKLNFRVHATLFYLSEKVAVKLPDGAVHVNCFEFRGLCNTVRRLVGHVLAEALLGRKSIRWGERVKHPWPAKERERERLNTVLSRALVGRPFEL